MTELIRYIVSDAGSGMCEQTNQRRRGIQEGGGHKDKPNQILTKALSHYKIPSVNNKEKKTYKSCDTKICGCYPNTHSQNFFWSFLSN